MVTVVTGKGSTVGQAIVDDKRIPLVSFTGSTEVGRMVSEKVHARFGRTILELGGNNAAIIAADADLELAFQGSVFAAAGTAGQRCTTLRRIILHESVYDGFVNRLVKAYKSLPIGDPMHPKTLVGPLNSKNAVKDYENGLKKIVAQGGQILCGGKVLSDRPGNYVEPTVVAIDPKAPIV